MFLPSNITLQFGDSGDFVAELQRRLAAVGAHDEASISGFYDGQTVNSVSSFQSRHGLRADGIAGPETLRRLNGVASGDATSNSDTQEEEDKKKNLASDQLANTFYHMDQQPMGLHAPAATAEVVRDVAAAGVAAEAAHQFADPAHHATQQALTPDMQLQQMLAQQQQMQMQQQMQQQNDMQLQQQAAQQQSVPQPTTPDMQLQQLLAQQAQQPQPLQAASTEQVAPQTAQAEQGRGGIVGRAMQKMDALLQKLSDHFERKLPPSVLDEVKNIGQHMMQSGVREVAIPGGPEPARAPQTPARGPDQQIPQRG